MKKYNWKVITFVLNYTNIHKNSPKETQDICGHFYACDGILFPDYQLISRQIRNQVAHGHKAIGSRLKSVCIKSVQFVYPNSISFTWYIKNNIDIKYRTKRVNGTTYIEFIALSTLSKLDKHNCRKRSFCGFFLQVCEDRWFVHFTIIQFYKSGKYFKSSTTSSLPLPSKLLTKSKN